MKEQEKHDALVEEIEVIASPKFREMAEWFVKNAPDYFFKIPASSSGKYHPSYALGDGGLLRHTKAAFRIANMLLTTKTFGKQYNSNQKDILLIAILIHDMLKQGLEEGGHTVKDHPLLVAKHFEKCIADQGFSEATPFWIDAIQRTALWNLVESHMGEWNRHDTGTMPLPKSEAQKFVHLCDYLASRKELEFNFKL
jgi:hypothetical protein